MTDDFKDEIRSRMVEVDYIYRGDELPDLTRDLRRGVVTGSSHRVLTRAEPVMEADSLEGVEVGQIGFLEHTTVDVTGGFSGSLAQTHNFNGTDNTSAVLNADRLPVSPIRYTYPYFNENPGVYPHVRSSIASEIRHQTRSWGEHDLGTLIGFTDMGPRSARDMSIVETVDRIEFDGDNLPGTSTNSLIAREREWVAMTDEVDISGAVEGLVTVEEELGVRAAFTRGKDMIPADAPPAGEIVEDVYASLNEEVPSNIRHWLLVVDSIGDATDRDPEAWPVQSIQHAVSPRGEKVPPSEVPPQYRGINRL